MSESLILLVTLPVVSIVGTMAWDAYKSRDEVTAFFEAMDAPQPVIGSSKWYAQLTLWVYLPLLVVTALLAVLIAWLLVVAITQVAELTHSQVQLFRYGVAAIVIACGFPYALSWYNRSGRRRDQRLIRLKAERAGYSKANFMEEITTHGIPAELASDFYDYLQLWSNQLVPHFPIKPDDQLEDLYGVELWASDHIEFYTEKVNCPLPPDPEKWGGWPDDRDETVEGFLHFLTPNYTVAAGQRGVHHRPEVTNQRHDPRRNVYPRGCSAFPLKHQVAARSFRLQD